MRGIGHISYLPWPQPHVPDGETEAQRARSRVRQQGVQAALLDPAGSPFIPSTPGQGRDGGVCFPEGETEAQRGWVPCPRAQCSASGIPAQIWMPRVHS